MSNPLTPVTFPGFVFGHRFAVIHFWTPGNEGDRLMSQLLASWMPGKWCREIAFASLNIDLPAHLELGRQHKVFDVPFLAFYRDGELVRTTTGIRTPGILAKALRELVNPQTAK